MLSFWANPDDNPSPTLAEVARRRKSRPPQHQIGGESGVQNAAEANDRYIPICSNGGYSDRRGEPHFGHHLPSE